MAQAKPRTRRKSAARIRSGAEDWGQQITQLLELDLPSLRERWWDVFGAEPSSQIGRTLLIQAIAYRLQERALGGLKPSVQRILDNLIEDAPRAATKRVPTVRASAGTVLLREWRGVRHRVTVLDNEVVYEGRRYKSLSEVARLITGAHWSGPLFFGLTNRAREAANG
jgi:hypothetical protein